MSTANVLLPVWDTVGIAWKKVSGAKATFWAAIGILILVGIGFAILNAIFKNVPILQGTISFLQIFVNYLFQCGVLYIAIKRAFDLPITYRQMFRSFEKPFLWRLIWSYVLQMLLMLPFIVLIVASFFLQAASNIAGILVLILGIVGIIVVAIRLFLSPGFILDKDQPAWEAIKASFHATRDNFWRLIGLFIIEMVILTIAAIPLLIGLIWALPLLFIIYGEVYKALLPNAEPL